MKKDLAPIGFPIGTPRKTRALIRAMIFSVGEIAKNYETIIIACSGGIDSTVLVHALGMARKIQGIAGLTTAIYVDHQLRDEHARLAERTHVSSMAQGCLTQASPHLTIDVGHGPNLQARARELRYAALEVVANSWGPNVCLMTAHTGSDVAETALFSFISGRHPKGIKRLRGFGKHVLARPLLAFMREDIEEYARVWGLSWCEDSSNCEDHYTRNKIRHWLVPWINSNINKGAVKKIAREYSK